MAHDETPKKPEWFEMAENDVNPADYIEETSSPLKTSKRLPIIALLATGAILAGGSVFANVNQEQPASAENFTGSPAHQNPDNVDPGAQGSTLPGDSTTAGMTLPSGKTPPSGIKVPTDGDGEHKFVPGQRPPHDEDGDHPFPPRRHHEDENHDFEGDDD